MNYLQKLLQGETVEWKTLGEVAELSNIGVDKKSNANEKSVRLLNFVDVVDAFFLGRRVNKKYSIYKF